MAIDQNKIISVYLQEARDHLDDLDSVLLEIEKNPHSPELQAQFMRSAHTLKGASGTAGMIDIADMIHEMEGVMDLLRNSVMAPGPEMFNLLFESIDVFSKSLEGIARGDASLQGELRRKTSELSSFGGRESTRAKEEEEANQGMDEIALGEYDRVRIRAMLKKGNNLYLIGCTCASDVQDRPAWGARILKVLRGRTDVIAVSPLELELDHLDEGGRLLVLAGGDMSAHDLRELLESPSIEDLHIDDYLESEQGGVQAGTTRVSIRDTVKVDLERVDSLVEMIGELVIVESMMANAPEILMLSSSRINDYLGQLSRITRDLQDVGMRMRMVPVRGVFQKMARLVRDLSKKNSKEINLIYSGEGTEMDRSMVERIGDPLLHIIRNAVDHGMESAKKRKQSGKPAAGRISLFAYHQGGSIIIEVSDDGRGLDRDAIVQKALSLGMISDASKLGDGELYNLIFSSGFSTAGQVTEISGRGVGLDVVKRAVESMHGRVTVASRPGLGITIKMILPLTMAIIDGMLVACGSEQYILPTLSIVESIQPDRSMLSSFAQKAEMLKVRDEILPMIRLSDLFQISDAQNDPTRALVVVVESIGRKMGLLVDNVLKQQQVVIKNMGVGMGDTRYLSGAAIMSDGRVGLILNVDEIGSLINQRVLRRRNIKKHKEMSLSN